MPPAIRAWASVARFSRTSTVSRSAAPTATARCRSIHRPYASGRAPSAARTSAGAASAARSFMPRETRRLGSPGSSSLLVTTRRTSARGSHVVRTLVGAGPAGGGSTETPWPTAYSHTSRYWTAAILSSRSRPRRSAGRARNPPAWRTSSETWNRYCRSLRPRSASPSARLLTTNTLSARVPGFGDDDTPSVASIEMPGSSVIRCSRTSLPGSSAIASSYGGCGTRFQLGRVVFFAPSGWNGAYSAHRSTTVTSPPSPGGSSTDSPSDAGRIDRRREPSPAGRTSSAAASSSPASASSDSVSSSGSGSGSSWRPSRGTRKPVR
jgi:hypothetical protein